MSFVKRLITLGIVWVIALAEPTPIGEAAATVISLSILGLDDETDSATADGGGA